jgi:chromosome segregation ATPase
VNLLAAKALEDAGLQTGRSNTLKKEHDKARAVADQSQAELEEARTIAANYLGELTFCNLALEDSQKEVEKLKHKISALETAEQQPPRQLPEARETNARNDTVSRELETAKTSIQRLTQELNATQAKSKSDCSRFQAKIRDLDGAVSRREKRIEELVAECATLRGKLQTLRNESKGKGRAEPTSDVFNHRLDQVSEAHIKSGVESLNDTLDNLVMELVDKGEQRAGQHSKFEFDPTQSDYPDTPLFRSLRQHDLTQDNRGLLLDALLHDRLHTELFDELFSGEVASIRTDPTQCFESTIQAMTHHGA